ncbi:MAG: nitroreductase family protein [Lachnospiraceae bacterium]|nr:nitroreductase family protein [Lachnospiraceae bacterium]
MELSEAMKLRHSVRKYKEQPLDEKIKQEIWKKIDECNKESGLHIQFITDEPKAFQGMMARYGKFSGVTNYIALIGKKDTNLEEMCGYYGEKLVLFAQQLGLNTCWVAMTYSKIPGVFQIDDGEKLTVVISIGYGENQGVPHKSKSMEKVCKVQGDVPDWFEKGVEAALLAPTAMNQQKFVFSCNGNQVTVKPGLGFYSKIDLGIVKYHFELGAGIQNFIWE